MIKELIEKNRTDFEGHIEKFKEQIAQIRTGRASVTMVEDIMIDYYGAKAPIKQVASISVPEPRQIVIKPWNKDDLVSIEKGVRESQLNFSPVNDGEVIRIGIPSLTEERRRELVKLLNQKSEEARIKIRSAREEIWDKIQDLQKEGKISEDDKFSGKDELQKVTDEYNGKIEEIKSKKENEIMTV